MNTQQTLEQLKELKLYGMVGCYHTQLHQHAEKQPDAHTLVAVVQLGHGIFLRRLTVHLTPSLHRAS